MTILNKISFGALWSLGKLIGSLPQFIQYGLGDFLYFILYTVGRYRVKVTRMNLANAFPEKTEQERLKIEKRFYHHLSDLFIETMGLVALSNKQINERFIYENIAQFIDTAKKRGTICAMAHYGNWEYTTNFALHTENPVLAVYHPLKTKGSDTFFCRMRSRFGVEPVPMKVVFRTMIVRRAENCILALIADQTPPRSSENRWMKFLNQPTLFFLGMEQLALRQGMAIFFLNIRQPKRGYYIGRMEMIYDGKEQVEPFEITSRYRRKLEEMIRQDPALWMWSHRRWKHQKFDDLPVMD